MRIFIDVNCTCLKNAIMKLSTCLYLAALLLTASCTKDGTPGTKVTKVITDDARCASQVWVAATDHAINSTDLARATALFQSNNRSMDGLRLLRYQEESLSGHGYVHMSAERYLNDVCVFNATVVRNFSDGVALADADEPLATDLDTIPKLRVTQVRSLFATTLTKESPGFAGNADSCMTMQFGYFNINMINGVGGVKLVKAWKAKLANYDYPYAIYSDEGGQLGFESGIMTLRQGGK